MPNRSVATPPPVGEDTTPPVITVNTPAAAGSFTGTIPFNVTISDADSDVSNVWIGLGGNPIPAQAYVDPASSSFTGSLNVGELAPGNYFFYVSAIDSEGNQSSTSFELTVAAPTSGFQSLSGGVIGRAEVSGNLTPAATTVITSVIQRGETEITYKIPRFYEVFADGSFGAEVVWDSGQQRFEYAA
jgi:hypothetical protein